MRNANSNSNQKRGGGGRGGAKAKSSPPPTGHGATGSANAHMHRGSSFHYAAPPHSTVLSDMMSEPSIPATVREEPSTPPPPAASVMSRDAKIDIKASAVVDVEAGGGGDDDDGLSGDDDGDDEDGDENRGCCCCRPPSSSAIARATAEFSTTDSAAYSKLRWPAVIGIALNLRVKHFHEVTVYAWGLFMAVVFSASLAVAKFVEWMAPAIWVQFVIYSSCTIVLALWLISVADWRRLTASAAAGKAALLGDGTRNEPAATKPGKRSFSASRKKKKPKSLWN